MIPKGITAEHIRTAMRRVLHEGVPEDRRSKLYCLVDSDAHFPPKYVISLAHKEATGRCWPSTKFTGGKETNEFLEHLGFPVVKCEPKCGGTRRGVTPDEVAPEPTHPTPRSGPVPQIPTPPPSTRDRARKDSAIRDRLLAFGETIEREELFPTPIPEAAALIFRDPFAFLLACSLNRGTSAEIVWTIPYCLAQELDHLDPHALHSMAAHELDHVIHALPRRPRYIGAAAHTVKDLAELVVHDCQGEARRLWEGRTAEAMRGDLRRIRGVGDGIASMTAVLLARAYGVRFPDLIDIKPDVHTKRVLYRLGVAAAEKPDSVAVEAARRLNPEYPGALDSPLWVVGRRWCHKSQPHCEACGMAAVCQRVGVS